MSLEYQIRTVGDFQLVPRERLGECLTDFATWLSIRGKQTEFLTNVHDLMGVASGIEWIDCFHWIDDGLRGISALHFEGPDGKEIGTLQLPLDEAA